MRNGFTREIVPRGFGGFKQLSTAVVVAFPQGESPRQCKPAPNHLDSGDRACAPDRPFPPCSGHVFSTNSQGCFPYLFPWSTCETPSRVIAGIDGTRVRRPTGPICFNISD